MTEGDPMKVTCPFCLVPPGQACETTAFRRPLRHRRHHPARHRAVGAPEPILTLDRDEKSPQRPSEPLDMKKIAATWELHDGPATEVGDPPGRSTRADSVADDETR